MIACEQKAMLFEGGIADQPAWFIDMLSWFSPSYEMQKFTMKAQMVLGDGDATSKRSAAMRQKLKGPGPRR
jgi:hypothetical protein